MRDHRHGRPGVRPGPSRLGGQGSLGRAALRDPRFLALVLGYLAVSTWLSFWPSNSWQTNVYWVVQVPGDLLFCLSARKVARHSSVDPAARGFWRLVTIAAGCFVTGDAIRTLEGFVGLETTDPGPAQSACFVVGQAIFLYAMSRYPGLTGSKSARARFVLDAAIVVSGSGAAVWFLLTTPGAAAASSLGVISGLLISAEVAMVGFLAVKLILSGRAPTTPLASATMILAGVTQVILTAALPIYGVPLRYGMVLSAQLLPTVLIALGPLLQSIELRLEPNARPARRPRPYSLLPYGVVGVVYGLLLFALLSSEKLDARSWGMVTAVGLVTGLVVWRQLLSATENSNLIAQLDVSLGQLQSQKEWFGSLVAHSSDVTTVSNAHNVVTWASPAGERVLGMRPEDLTGKSFIDFMHPDDIVRLAGQWNEMLANPGAALTSQYRVKSTDRGWRWLETINTNLLDDPAIAGIVSNGRDITEARELQEMLVHQASHDVLTQLANRRLFTERLESGDSTAAGGPVALLMIDLDGFKPINDTHGHHVGDAVLVAVAERIRHCVRPTDTAARLGGDEFAVLMPGASLDEAQKLVERFQAALAEPIAVDQLRLTIGASVGVTVGDAADAEALLHAADVQMYAAKREGRGRTMVGAGRS